MRTTVSNQRNLNEWYNIEERRFNNLITPFMHLSAKSGSWVFPLKSPNVHPTSFLTKNSIGWMLTNFGVLWIPRITVNPHPCHTHYKQQIYYNYTLDLLLFCYAHYNLKTCPNFACISSNPEWFRPSYYFNLNTFF